MSQNKNQFLDDVFPDLNIEDFEDDDWPVDVLDEMSSELIIKRRTITQSSKITIKSRFTNVEMSKKKSNRKNFNNSTSSKRRTKATFENSWSDTCPSIQPKIKNRTSKSQLSTDSNVCSKDSVNATGGSDKFIPSRIIRDQGWEFGDEIGSGGFSHVYRVRNSIEFPNETERGIACKVIDLQVVNSDWTRKHLRTELRLCEMLDHPNLMRAIKVLKTRSQAFIFMPLAIYGTVTEFLIGHKRPLREPIARSIFHDLVDGVAYLHARNIVHRDLKLDNFLLGQRHRAFISDFGFAVIGNATSQLEANQQTMSVWCSTICGTPEYVAPEIHGLIRCHKYDGKPADMYALGVSVFEMLHMLRPFQGGPFVVRCPELLRMQTQCEFIVISRIKLTKECKTLIHSLLNPNPNQRPTAESTLADKWFPISDGLNKGT